MIGLVILALTQGGGSGGPGHSHPRNEALRQAKLARGRPVAAAAGVAEARSLRRLAGDIPHPNLSYERTGDTPHQHLIFDESFAWLLTRGPDRHRGELQDPADQRNDP